MERGRIIEGETRTEGERKIKREREIGRKRTRRDRTLGRKQKKISWEDQ